VTPVFPSHDPVIWPVTDRTGGFPARRVFCVGKNYADHVAEMAALGLGSDVAKSEPIFFTKSVHCLVHPGAPATYPANTSDLHHEVELVVCMGPDGRDGCKVWGHAVGIDLTRRDLQSAAKAKGQPWDRAKSFPDSAPMGAITPGAVRADAAIALTVNRKPRQSSTLAHMIWSVEEIVARLQVDMDLQAGDVIFTGTPAGVGAVVAGDVIVATVEGLATLQTKVI